MVASLLMMVMSIVVVVMMVPTGVSARFGIKRRLDRIDVAAKTLDHFLHHMVGPDANAVAEQLHRQVPVAEMPGNAHQFALIVRVDLEQRLRLRAHADHPAIVEHQPIAMPQPRGLRQIQQDLAARLGR